VGTDPLEKWIKRLMVVTVLAVAVFAAIQSYTHNFDLALAHHERGASLRLLPLSVDWLMLAAGLVLLIESRKGFKPKLPKFVLWVGITATLLGNVTALWIYGPVATVIGAWGPLCLVLTIEMGMYLVRSARAKPEAKELSNGHPVGLPGSADNRRLDRGGLGADPASGGLLDPAVAVAVEAVDSPGDPIQGWGQLGRQDAGLNPGLTGIGLSNGRK
jgi:hypothetical protein